MARLSYQARKAMPKSEFALPGNKTSGNKAGKGAYPIPDASHARNALARVAQHGTPSEQATVRRKVHEKFPGIGKEEHGENLRRHHPGMNDHHFAHHRPVVE